MARRASRKVLYIVIAALLALVIIIGVVVFAKSQSSAPAPKESSSKNDEAQTTDKASSTPNVPEDTTEKESINLENVSTVTIEPMTIVVSYMKGAGGFDFQVLRNPNGTQYVQFSSEELVGTKCTSDQGVFASIIEKPTADESATLTKTTTVDGTSYGLALADESCTKDAVLLKQYQDAFSEPFTLLKKM